MSCAKPATVHRLTKTLTLEKVCGCKRNEGKPCYTLFSRDHYESVRMQCKELSRYELHRVLLRQILTQPQHQCTQAPATTALQYGLSSWRSADLPKDLPETAWNQPQNTHVYTHTNTQCQELTNIRIHMHTPTPSHPHTCTRTHNYDLQKKKHLHLAYLCLPMTTTL